MSQHTQSCGIILCTPVPPLSYPSTLTPVVVHIVLPGLGRVRGALPPTSGPALQDAAAVVVAILPLAVDLWIANERWNSGMAMHVLSFARDERMGAENMLYCRQC